MQYLHISRLLAKQTKELMKAGKKGERIVATYEMIVDRLRQEGCRDDKIFCKRTKKGEQRMKNCVKYDLGSGYRLITVRSGDHLFITFLGGHDDADTWFNRHRYDIFTPDKSLYTSELIEPKTKLFSNEEAELEPVPDNDDLYEEELQAKLDDSILKSVFQGLYSSRSATNESSRE